MVMLAMSQNGHAIPRIEIYDIYEVKLKGPRDGNPYKDVALSAVFEHEETVHRVNGFYDGNGIYIIRFMPNLIGKWSFETSSNVDRLNKKRGKINCIEASEGNHGMVRVSNTFHFKYDAGTQFYPIGTTSYAWIHQGDDLENKTLETLKNSPFNKIRMCVFPKWYPWNKVEPEHYPYAGTAPDQWDFFRFNPEFFHHLETRIAQLRDLGIQADLIIFHPYDYGHWGFDRMTDEQDDFYLRYLIARLGAYRNVWWSLANEFDFMKEKEDDDWDRFFEILSEEDPYQHLRSIHNGARWYDHSKPWVTHASIQSDTYPVRDWRETYHKPVIVDECKYEGNIRYLWGDLTAIDMTHRFWDAVTRGGYATHGETYMHDNDILWWSKGGILHGESPQRIAFLKKIISEAPDGGFEPFMEVTDSWNRRNAVRVGDDYILVYFGERQPIEREIIFPEQKTYRVEIIDIWNMTVSPHGKLYSGKSLVPLPGKPYIALRAIRVENE